MLSINRTSWGAGRSAGTPRSSARPGPRMVARSSDGSQQLTVMKLKAKKLTPEAFAPYGQVCEVMEDGVPFGEHDARLVLDAGTPRLYLMRLRDKDLTFDRITFHRKCTQCLGTLGDAPWFVAVSQPTMDVAKHPTAETMDAFCVPPGVFVKFNPGTWHAGPLFTNPHMDFYNLELSDTNVTDHNTWVFRKEGLKFEIAVDDTDLA